MTSACRRRGGRSARDGIELSMLEIGVQAEIRSSSRLEEQRAGAANTYSRPMLHSSRRSPQRARRRASCNRSPEARTRPRRARRSPHDAGRDNARKSLRTVGRFRGRRLTLLIVGRTTKREAHHRSDHTAIAITSTNRSTAQPFFLFLSSRRQRPSHPPPPVGARSDPGFTRVATLSRSRSDRATCTRTLDGSHGLLSPYEVPVGKDLGGRSVGRRRGAIARY